ncbi:MAG: NADH-quinone oxidoreductase subunit M, partial [Candidatus Azotimanducaceae bacterium]
MVVVNLLALILLLLAGGIGAALSSRWHTNAPRWVSLTVLILASLWLADVWSGNQAGDLYALTRLSWIPALGISVQLEMDGLSLMMVALTLFLGVVAVISSWSEIEHRHGFFQFNLMWTLAGVVGVFTALDLFLFFVFWEVMLIP